ncbi:hypothetical protein XFF7767_370001 [Xanthomonas citri pv. fuscans]|nr:hypothetical protein XFF7767_370001 [Xanthomonas citri pv. fuscans]
MVKIRLLFILRMMEVDILVLIMAL